MYRFRACVIALLFGVFAATAVPAQETQPTAPPAGLTQQQFDALVTAIGDSVARKLREEGVVPAKPAGKEAGREAGKEAAPAAEAPKVGVEDSGDAASRFASDFANRAETVLLAIPSLPGVFARIPSALDRSANGGQGPGAFLLLLLAGSVAVLAVEPLYRLLLTGPRRRLAAAARPDPESNGLLQLLALAVLDAVALGLTALVAFGLAGTWFDGTDPQHRLGALVLGGLFSWRLYMFAFRLSLRPVLADARLVPLDDTGARTVFHSVAIAVGFVIGLRTLLRLFIAMQIPREVISAGQVVLNLVMLAVFIWACVRSRDPVARWFESFGGAPGRQTAGAAVARRWLPLGIAFFVLLIATQIYGAISAKYSVPVAMLLTVNVVIGLLLAETVLMTVTNRLGGRAVTPPGVRPPIRLADVVVRCLRVAMFIVAGVSVAQAWIVDVVGLVDQSGWHDLTRSSLRAGATLFLAYVGFEFVRLATHRYVAPAGGATMDEDAGHTAASRLATLMPLLRIALTVVIAVIALLIVLSELGVNITPLIAGASVLGLAVSFGSQTLVRDIVSGVFYLADDAFRVGEYIDCGKAKGTVEGFTLRSIRLRHQNGQVHTIPFGQLGQITNFSRDWTTVKFNLKFARDTDIEKLRKVVKKIGQEMMENEEIKGEILEPLKMQGIADIMENALVVRFKFTVKPGKPSYIQREAVKRMVRIFHESGIEFANALVAVQTMHGADPAANAAAAAQSVIDSMKAASTTAQAS
jgi:small-conductance mechanosensitive channel